MLSCVLALQFSGNTHPPSPQQRSFAAACSGIADNAQVSLVWCVVGRKEQGAPCGLLLSIVRVLASGRHGASID